MAEFGRAGAWFVAHAAPFAAFVVALAGAAARKQAKFGMALGAVALLVGWGVLLAGEASPRAVWAPHRGAEPLLAAALVSAALAALLAWRGGRNPRLLLGLDALFAGWWVARTGVGDADFWRVGFVTMVAAFWLGRVMRGEAMRSAAVGLTLLGALFAAGAGPLWLTAGAVAAAAGAGLVVGQARFALPAAPLAALIGVADLAGGRLWRGRVDGVDLACLAALLASLAVPAVARRIGAKGDRLLPLLAAVATAIGLSALVWLGRRALLR